MTLKKEAATRGDNRRKRSKKLKILGIPGWRSGLAPAFGPGRILETRDRIPRQAPCMEPASPSACVCLSLSLMNK